MYRIATHVAWQSVGGETIVVDLSTGNTMGLNATASLIWTAIESTPPESIAARLSDLYGIDLSTTIRDVNEFVDDMKRRGLIAASEGTQ
ncbi:MAG: PqqD family protein [Thermoanaerobaculia bacterium]